MTKLPLHANSDLEIRSPEQFAICQDVGLNLRFPSKMPRLIRAFTCRPKRCKKIRRGSVISSFLLPRENRNNVDPIIVLVSSCGAEDYVSLFGERIWIGYLKAQFSLLTRAHLSIAQRKRLNRTLFVSRLEKVQISATRLDNSALPLFCLVLKLDAEGPSRSLLRASQRLVDRPSLFSLCF